MAWPLGKLNPDDSTRWGTRAGAGQKNILELSLSEILPMAITGTLSEYHRCLRINKK